MKNFFTYLLLFLFSIQSFETAIISLNFNLNQEFFASICDNKDKPEMNCNGKCHLKKQIKKHEKEKSDQKNLTQKEFELFIQCLDILKEKQVISNQKHLISYTESLHISQYFFDVFHPPKHFTTS